MHYGQIIHPEIEDTREDNIFMTNDTSIHKDFLSRGLLIRFNAIYSKHVTVKLSRKDCATRGGYQGSQ